MVQEADVGKLHPMHRSPMRKIGVLLVILALIQFVVWLIPTPPQATGIAHYLMWHTLMETLSIVIALMVFAVGWHTHQNRNPGNVVLLACIFFVVGMLDFSHMASYVGMPEFITPNDSQKHLNFWMAARFLAALGLLIVAIRPWERPVDDATKYTIFTVLVTLCLAINMVVIYAQPALPDWFIPGQGLTLLKKNLEYLFVTMNVLAAAILWHKMRKRQSFNAALLFGAIATMALSELFFTYYTTMTGAYNVLGHVYKVISYLFIYSAVVVETIDRPYQKLVEVRQNLELSVKASNTGLWDWEIGTNAATFSPAWKAQLGYQPDELEDNFLTWERLLHPDDAEAALSRAREFITTPGQVVYESEFRMRHKDGSYHWILARGERQDDARGNAIRLVGSHTDLTERKRAEERFRIAVEAAPNAMLMVDDTSTIILSNSKADHLFGYTSGGLIGQQLEILIPMPKREIHQHYFKQAIANPVERKMGEGRELFALHRDGHEFRVEVALTPIGGEAGQYVIASVIDITSRVESEQRINQLINFDPLTGLPNRQRLTEQVQQAIEVARRDGSRMAIFYIDIDHFKNINDSLGHHIGDKLLIAVGNRLRTVLSERDTLSRVGGDEFVIAASEGNQEQMVLLATKLLASVARPYQLDGNDLIVTSSIGIAIYPDDGEDFSLLYQRADTAMYRAKQDSRNNFRFFTADMQSRSARALKLESAMHNALERHEFFLCYQPQLSMDGRKVIGVEALIRWRHPELGMISPAEFIPLAESSGKIITIGSWVLRTAVQQLKQWLDEGLPPMVMAVNLSAIQFRDPNLLGLVNATIAEFGLAPHYLELELTEGAAMDHPMKAIAIMESLSAIGVQISIDDFGTGYSSLSYLKKFNIYKLKIDQSFVRDIASDADDRAIVTAIIQLAKSLGLKTIAEGVETSDQREFLNKQGCDEVQGYLFSKPLPADQIVDFIKAIPD